MASPEMLTLVPFDQVETGCLQAVWLTIARDQLVTMGMSEPVLTIQSTNSPGAFAVRKVGVLASSPLAADCQTEEWNLGLVKTALKPGSTKTALLLGPSALGGYLYGGELYDAGEFIAKYGVIQPSYDKEDGEWGVSIVMPQRPYNQLSRLTLS